MQIIIQKTKEINSHLKICQNLLMENCAIFDALIKL